MDKRLRIVFLTVLAVTGMIVSGCSSNSPQKELTFTGHLNAQQRAMVERQGSHAKGLLYTKLAQETEVARRNALNYREARPKGNGAIAGLGFSPDQRYGYVVYRDGNASLIDRNGEVTALDRLTKRIERTLQAGNYLLGLSPHGSQSVWNTGNLTQQAVLRFQRSTFGQIRLFDAQVLRDTNYLVTASEEQLLEMWSLSSGDLIRHGQLRTRQPRRIGKGSVPDFILYGTNDGQVGAWRGKTNSTNLYSHSGPILDLAYLATRELIVSAGKDGAVKVYDSRHGRLLHVIQFPNAIYQLVTSPDERRIVAIPATGAPVMFDLETGKETRLKNPFSPNVSKGIFVDAGRKFVARHGAAGVSQWNFAASSIVRTPIAPEGGGTILDFVYSAQTGMMMVLTDDNRIQYWDMPANRYLRTAIHSDVDIVSMAMSENGTGMIFALVDGRVARMRINRRQNNPLQIH